MTPEDSAALRKPFPPETVGKLPKAGVMLDYVGHAAITDRLLAVDPAWTWEPVAFDEHGLPAYDKAGGLWIRLTVAGVTRLGYGDGPDPKQRIGDALRNAAMRFGVALDLWSKEELEGAHTPAVQTDPVWFADWLERVSMAPSEAQLRGCWEELQSAASHKVSLTDYTTGVELIKSRKVDLTAEAEAAAQGELAGVG